jgi:hypothetical protein
MSDQMVLNASAQVAGASRGAKASSAKPARSNPKRKKATAARKTKSKPTARTKHGTVLQLLSRKGGASIAELEKATGWQAHSVRGFLSGKVKKRMGLPLRSEPTEQGVRRYMIAKA